MVRIKGAPKDYTFMSDAFYLDVGPLILVWAGLLDADDPLMKWSEDDVCIHESGRKNRKPLNDGSRTDLS